MIRRVLLVLAHFAAAAYAHTDMAKITVQSPPGFKDHIPLGVGNFGRVPYGKSLVGYVVMADPPDACSPLQPIKRESKNSQSIFILIERGKCEFVTKAHYAEIAGAKMAIIVDNIESDDVKEFIMADDGMGSGVGIPSIIISPQNGDKFKEILKGVQPLSFSIKFRMPQATHVNYTLWLSSSNKNSFLFLKEFYNYHKRLGNLVTLTPRYVLWYCLHCKASKFDGTSKNGNCVSRGRYCAPDPDGQGEGTGKDVVLEDLRQKCIYLKAGVDKWWEYTTKYVDRADCLNFKNTDCSFGLIKEIGVSQDTIKKCVEESFVGSESDIYDRDNNILKPEQQDFSSSSIPYWPAIVINKVVYRGNLIPADEVYDAVCAAFSEKPLVCELQDDDVTNVDVDDVNYILVVVIVVVILALFLFCMIVVYRKMVRRELTKQMDSQINNLVSQYFALNDGKNKGNQIKVETPQ